MTDTVGQTQFDGSLPSQERRAVSDQNQFQLPAAFVTELGFPSGKKEIAHGAKIAWYYHEGDHKAVLGNDDVDRPTLELVGVCRLSDVSNEALASGDVDGARVTIISELPESLYERLTR
jgi:hypothetical protein